MTPTQYFIPRVSAAQIAIIAARSTGVIAASIAAEARNNANRPNPYAGQIDQLSLKSKELYKSTLGTPVFIDVTFGDSKNPTVYKDLKTGNDVQLPVMTFQAILCSVVFPRNIVKTEIQGRNGTVKEYIGEGDATLSFRGIITGLNGQYPSGEVAQLRTLSLAPVPVPVISEFLNNLDIYTVVFEDRSFEQDEGGYSYQTFSLNAISDTPQELKLSGV